ncbi:uncharacterized protein si:busm1-163l24.3 [Megalops cyprinoides]|uniref:uncharacterized protein si:busm1-163l24.3 n=1 Tax=Megalops cyprinoides TaxID=118141 RepID=UPI0018650D4D|nr:uncharacterized protein si:busm1-163l24.3 [Megalops cyprinoides]XP_036374644.1 uncharacterized protein si:busm1-163l24.3 [Megalops cyprinoides]XP_036374725.1 uncharacterized protein si:busm1-163l24.3 [Megalops cyprinoides]XP_036374811.1 uncharacterized protein si:busm1-163l24.3 [Megalops cyprinoides]XP_036374884.1 uncharacterized protein si:busm1-163l24.3 [Megalops cyprinoides]XP_036374966.1 uncharacterized protein si:busm1-163l24.3 [Megalops cyprinoides]XP_036375049.1 uncharacterized prot
MEGEGRTVIVRGVPVGFEERRLMDKLCIHFLRKKNGGGEITSITLPKSMPGCALITFEETEVAQRVVQREKHDLSVDGKVFELTVRLFHTEVDPDEVFLSLTVVIDYSRLPLGKVAVSSLRQSFPDVRFSFSTEEELCTLKGRYSEVQTLITHLLNLIDPRASTVSHLLRPEDIVGAPSPSGKKSSAGGSVYHTRGCERQVRTRHARQDFGQELGSLGLDISNTERDHPADQTLESYEGVEEKAGILLDEAPLEDFSLVMDSDIFRYLQQHCREEYQHILSQHGVEVVDVCTQDVTTVYLQTEAGAAGRGVERVKQVHGELGRLYQEMEAQLRKEQLPKEGIQRESLKQAFEALQQRLPKIMLSDDKSHIYIVGSRGDVSEAKQFLLDMKGAEGGSRVWGADHTTSLMEQDRDTLFLPSTSTSVSTAPILDGREMDKILKPHKTERTEVGKEYKLAARFKEVMSKTSRDGVPGLTFGDTKASDDTLKDFSSRQMLDSGHRFGTGAVVGTGSAGIGTEGFSLRSYERLNQTGKDILFSKTGSHSTTSMESKSHSSLLPTSNVLPSKTMQLTNMQSTVHHMDLFGNKGTQTPVIPPSGLGTQHKLKRANSFSGRIRPTQDLKESGTHWDIQQKTNRVGTSSLSNSTANTQEVYSVEVPVSTVVWHYIKECCRTQLEDITTDLQVKEIMEGIDLTLQLKGPDVARVTACQQELRKLVNMVTLDFDAQEVPLTKLGVTDPNDPTLEETCMELRNKFEKVKIWPITRSVFVMGPKDLCRQVVSGLMEAFCSGMERMKEMEEQMEALSLTSPFTQNQIFIPQTLTEYVKDQDSVPRSFYIPNEGLIETISFIPADSLKYSRNKPIEGEQGLNTRGKDNFQSKGSNQMEKKHESENGKDRGSPLALQKEPVLKLKQGMDWTMNRESLRSNAALTQPTWAGNRVLGPKDSGSISLPSSTQKAVLPNKESNPKHCSVNMQRGHSPTGPEGLKSVERHEPKHQGQKLEQKNEQNETQGHQGMSCECGASGSSITRMPCGVTLCPQCLVRVHPHCAVCPKADIRGIKGTMSFTEMSVTLAGHIKDMTLKITYNIPDGIQGEGHPNPGDPFRGGVFEAYLPLNEQTKRLLPLLKKAFNQGLTFTVAPGEKGGRVTWGNIPHKTRVDRGKSGNGYPDSSYISRLTEALKSLSTEEDAAIAKSQYTTNN